MGRKTRTACRKCSDRRRFFIFGAFRSEFPFGAGLGQTEKSQNSPSENIPKTQKNPAEIERFQPDLVGVSGFEPEASWSRTVAWRVVSDCGIATILHNYERIKP